MADLWQLIGSLPLLWLTLTLLVYVVAVRLFEVSGQMPLSNPVLLSVLVLAALLLLSDTSYDRYFRDARPLHLLLGPATVALAVPLHALWGRLRAASLPLLVTLVAGSLLGMSTAALTGPWLGLDGHTVLTLVPKSVTTPIAIGIAEQIGGLPSLTAVLVILTGILGAAFGLEILSVAGVTNRAARGFALGIAAHGIATARAYQADEESGSFAGLAMGLNGALTAGLAPVVAGWLARWLF